MPLLLILCLLIAPPAAAQDAPAGMTLEEVLHHTLENSPALKAARAELKATRELYPQARAGWKPTIDGEASVYLSDIDNSNFGGADGTTTKDVTFNIEQPLFRSGRTAAQIARAQALIKAGEAQLKQMEQNALLAAAQAYINILSDRKLLALRRDNESYLFQEYTATKERLDAGLLTVTDLKQAESRLARARAEMLSASGRLESNNAAFERATGLAPIHTLYYPAPDTLGAMTIDSLLAQIESGNPDIQATLYAQEASDHHIDASFREHFPQIFAFATYNKQYDPQPGIVDDSETRTIGLRAAIPIYDAGLSASRTREALNTAMQRRHDADDTRRRIRAALHTQWTAREAAIAEMASRRLAIAAAEKAREGVEAEARLGERTVLDILDADQEVLQAQSALIEARRNELLARYRIAALLGDLPNP